jgi:predicted TIM-barrel fold metal-dependent hydrolase
MWMLSSDSHVFEPPSLWLDRVPARLRDIAPRVEEADDADWWVMQGQRMFKADAGTKAGLRFEGQAALKVDFHYSDVREGAYTPAIFLDDNAADGVWGSVVYPSVGVTLFQYHDEAVLGILARAYNEWIAEFCAHDPNRLRGVAILDAENVAGAVVELERVVADGLRAALITVSPFPGNGYELDRYNPLWEAVAGLGVPLSLHIATDREAEMVGKLYFEAGVTNCDGAVRDSLARMIFSGVFERYPTLRVGAVEFESGWVAHFSERMDYTYTQRERQVGWARFADGVIPSDFMRRNVFVSFQEDPVGIHCRHLIGVDRLLWGSDYPHTESTFPRSQQILDDVLKGVPDDERTRIVRDNTAAIYGFDVPST